MRRDLTLYQSAYQNKVKSGDKPLQEQEEVQKEEVQEEEEE